MYLNLESATHKHIGRSSIMLADFYWFDSNSFYTTFEVTSKIKWAITNDTYPCTLDEFFQWNALAPNMNMDSSQPIVFQE